MSDQTALDELRDKAQALAERVKNDPGFVQRIKDDPFGTLGSAGIPEEVINQLVQGKTEEVEVIGYKYIDDVCNDATCWSSNCPECCYVTF